MSADRAKVADGVAGVADAFQSDESVKVRLELGAKMRPASLALLLLLALLALVVRFHNLTDVLIGGKFYFVDADCYSRMSRVQLVAAVPGTVVRWQGFENWPEGVFSHATAPLDYAILGLERVLHWVWPTQGRLADLGAETLDLAGALISPLFGVLLTLGAGFWAFGLRMKGGERAALWWTVPFLVAVSPPLVHATVFGRPDHQSLLLLLLGVALGAEQRLQSAQRSIGWAWAGGLAWGAALWVSLYEPLILGGVCLLLGLGSWRGAKNERVHWLLAVLLLVGIGHWVDGISVVLPSAMWNEALGRWGGTVGELQHLQHLSDLCSGTGLLLWLTLPALVVSGMRGERLAFWWLALLALLGTLTVWQIRWSPYCVLAFVGSLPWILALGSAYWPQFGAFVLSLLPLERAWEQTIFVSPTVAQRRHIDRAEWISARYCAERMRSDAVEPFIAAWWLSPALAYWSKQPGVAGSSHEGISGIMDSARFFLSTNPVEAREILEARSVRIVVASDSLRIVENASALLGRTPTSKPLAERLWQPDPGSLWGLEGESNVTLFRLLRPVPLTR